MQLISPVFYFYESRHEVVPPYSLFLIILFCIVLLVFPSHIVCQQCREILISYLYYNIHYNLPVTIYSINIPHVQEKHSCLSSSRISLPRVTVPPSSAIPQFGGLRLLIRPFRPHIHITAMLHQNLQCPAPIHHDNPVRYSAAPSAPGQSKNEELIADTAEPRCGDTTQEA